MVSHGILEICISFEVDLVNLLHVPGGILNRIPKIDVSQTVSQAIYKSRMFFLLFLSLLVFIHYVVTLERTHATWIPSLHPNYM